MAVLLGATLLAEPAAAAMPTTVPVRAEVGEDGIIIGICSPRFVPGSIVPDVEYSDDVTYVWISGASPDGSNGNNVEFGTYKTGYGC